MKKAIVFILLVVLALGVKSQTIGELKALYKPSFDSLKATIGTVYGSSLKIVSDANYTIPDSVGYVVYTSITADRTVTLPNPASYVGRMLVITHGGSTNVVYFSSNVRQSSTVTVAGVTPGNAITLKATTTEWVITKL